jgi:hypothetical protein
VKAFTKVSAEFLTHGRGNGKDKQGAESVQESRVHVEKDFIEELDLAVGVHPLEMSAYGGINST